MGTRKAQRGHHRLGSRIGKAHQLGGGHHPGDTVGDDQLALGRKRKHATHLHATQGCRINAVIGIAKNRRTIPKSVVHVSVAVDVPGPTALAVIDIDRAIIAPIAKR